jgi:hypothetical protein
MRLFASWIKHPFMRRFNATIRANIVGRSSYDLIGLGALAARLRRRRLPVQRSPHCDLGKHDRRAVFRCLHQHGSRQSPLWRVVLRLGKRAE